MIPLILSLLAALAVGVIAWQDRSWGAAAVLFALPSYLVRFSVAGIPLTMLEMLILTLFAVFVIRDWKKILAIRPAWWQVLFVLMFFMAGIFGVLVSPDVRAALGLFKAYMLEPVLFFCVVWIGISTKKEMNRLFGALVLSAAIVGFGSAIQYFVGWGIPEPWNLWDGNRRATFVYGYPNAVGLFIAPVLAATLSATILGKTYRSLLTVASVAMALGIFAARVEGAIIAVLAATLMTLLFTKARVWAIGAAVVALVSGFLIGPIRQILLFQDTSGDVRIALWKGTWSMLKDNPVFGAGLAGFPQTYDLYRLPSHVELLEYPHNILLNFWAELGLIGLTWLLVAIVTIIVIAVGNYRKMQIHSVAILAVLIALLVYGIVDVPYFKNDLAVIFWALIGIVFVLHKKRSESFGHRAKSL